MADRWPGSRSTATKYRVIWRERSGKKRRSFDKESEATTFLSTLDAVLITKATSPALLGRIGGKPTPTVVDFGRELIDDPDLRPNTRDMYSAALNRVEKEPLGGMQLGKVRPGDFRDFFRDLSANRNNVRSTLAKVFNAAVREGIIRTSPLVQANIKVKNGDKEKKLRILNPTEVERLASAAETDRDALAIRLGAYVGLRAGEVGGLAVEGIERRGDRCYLNIRRNAQRTTAGYIFGPPKTKTSKRRLSIDCSIADDLHRYMEANPPQADGTIFWTRQGHPLTDQVLTHATAIAAKRAGLRRVTFHDLRHTCASLLIEARMEPKSIQVYLGHSSIRMTYDVYGDLFPNADDPLADVMGALRAAATVKALPLAAGEAE